MNPCGSWMYRIDPKGRLFLPMELVKHFGPRVMLAVGRSQGHPILLLLTEAQWERERAAHGHRLEWWQTETGAATVAHVGANRRVTIPAHLRELFGLRCGDEQVIEAVRPATRGEE